jgi:hypothetical protein
VKEVNFTDKQQIFISHSSGADRQVEFLTWLDGKQTLLAVARSSGSIDIFEYISDTSKWSLNYTIDLEETILCMRATENGFLLVATESSVVQVPNNTSDKERSKIVTALPGAPYNVVSFMMPASNTDFRRDALLPGVPSHVVVAKDTAPPLVISLKTSQIEWSGKQANDTPLGISSKFHTTVMTSISERIFVAGDQSGKIRFYDIKLKKQPVYEIPVFKIYSLTNNYTGTSGMGNTRPITALCPSVDGTILYVADTYGCLFGIDIRKGIESNSLVIPKGKIGFEEHNNFCRKVFPIVKNYKGIMGTIRDIAVTPQTVFCVTAGRLAYAFDIKGKKFEKIFLKQKLTSCLPVTVSRIPGPSGVQIDKQDELSGSESSDSELDIGAEDLLQNIDEEVRDSYQANPKKRRK